MLLLGSYVKERNDTFETQTRILAGLLGVKLPDSDDRPPAMEGKGLKAEHVNEIVLDLTERLGAFDGVMGFGQRKR